MNKKHVRQIEDYADIISRHPAFNSDALKFEIILIGRTFSKNEHNIQSKLSSMLNKEGSGLINDDGKIKLYIKKWYTIIDEFKLKNQYLMDNLKIQREDLSHNNSTSLVLDLQVQA